MSVWAWGVTAILGLDLLIIAVLAVAAWRRDRGTRQLEALYRLPAREPGMRA